MEHRGYKKTARKALCNVYRFSVKAILLPLMLLGLMLPSVPVRAGFLDDIASSWSEGSTLGSVLGALGLGVSPSKIKCAVIAEADSTVSALLGTATGRTLGVTVCSVVKSFEGLPGILSTIAYFAGIILAIWALLQLKDHVVDPSGRVPLSAPIKKFIVGGMFFAFPTIINTARALYGDGGFAYAGSGLGAGPMAQVCGHSGILGGIGSAVESVLGTSISSAIGLGASAGSSGPGLDCMIARLVADLYQPVAIAASVFTYFAGLIFILIGTRRLLKSAEEGQKGSLGTGTYSLFILGGALLAFDNIVSVVSQSLFQGSVGALSGTAYIYANGALSYNPGLSDGALNSVNGIITTVMAVAFMIGLISMIRGVFILKEVADGNGNASLMAAATHLFGGAVAVNLGDFIMALQETLGITSIGLEFS